MSILPQLEEKIYSLVPELEQIRESILVDYRECIYVCSICHQQCNSDWCDCSYKKKHYYPIYPHHWLPLFGGDCRLSGNGLIFKWVEEKDEYDWIGPHYDFKKSFKDQSPEFHQFLMENIK